MSSGKVKLEFNLQKKRSSELVSENITILEKKLGKLEVTVKEMTIKATGLKR